MKRRVFIVHGWGGTPQQHWLPWLAQELTGAGFVVDVPAMPETDAPRIDAWVRHLAEAVGEPDAQTYFVGHSIGCQTIMRYLETLSGKTVGGCVFVAGWFHLQNLENEEERIAQPWLETPIDVAKVLAATQKFTVLLSDNDPYDAVEENARLFRTHLHADVHVLHAMEHFTEEGGVTELPLAGKVIRQYAASAQP